MNLKNDDIPFYNDIERIVPDLICEDERIGNESLALHLERYEFACQHLKGSVILDIACGTGYGSHLIAESSTEGDGIVIGIDNNVDVVSYASRRYPHPNLHHVVQDAFDLGLSQKFTSIVSLETIEHLSSPELFANNLKSILVPGGRLICSCPTTLSTDVNPHHRNDFTAYSIRDLFHQFGFQEIACLHQAQPYSISKIFSPNESRTEGLRSNLISYYIRNPSQFVSRIISTLRYGLVNHYITIVWENIE